MCPLQKSHKFFTTVKDDCAMKSITEQVVDFICMRISGNYDVVVSQKLLSRFTSKNQDLTYYIALEPDSTFE